MVVKTNSLSCTLTVTISVSQTFSVGFNPKLERSIIVDTLSLNFAILVVTGFFLLWLLADWNSPNKVVSAVVRLSFSAVLFVLSWKTGTYIMCVLWAINIGINLIPITIRAFPPVVAATLITVVPTGSSLAVALMGSDLGALAWLPYAVYPQLAILTFFWLSYLVFMAKETE